MPSKSERPKVPNFKTEAEEAEWWDSHIDMVEDELLRAMRDGTTQVLTGERLSEKLKRSNEPTSSLTVPLSEQDLAKIHALAERRSVEDEAVAAELPSQALKEL